MQTDPQVSVSARYENAQGPYSMIITAELGPCGTCGEPRSCFINRTGPIECSDCDEKRGNNARS
jgi:hypothetical protein